MNSTIGIVLVALGLFSLGVGLLRPVPGMSAWRRWRILIGGPVAIILGILILTGVIGG